MAQYKQFVARWALPILIGVCLSAIGIYIPRVSAINPLPNPDPAPGSYGLEATKKQAPPTEAARITTPGNGASFRDSPITVNGLCKVGLLVQIYNNGVMVGSVMCARGSFSVQVSLFVGTNDLTAIVYDELGQAGPRSNLVRVTYGNANLSAFGELITLTSSYGRRSAAAGSQLGWPLQLSGGTGPYALSIDWGDGTPAELKSQAMAGVFNIYHTYKRAGIYQVNIRVTDVNGVSAFLQLVAVASGEVDVASKMSATEEEGPKVIVRIVWIPAVIALMLLLPTYWLGRRSQLVSIRNKMLKERDKYQDR